MRLSGAILYCTRLALSYQRIGPTLLCVLPTSSASKMRDIPANVSSKPRLTKITDFRVERFSKQDVSCCQVSMDYTCPCITPVTLYLLTPSASCRRTLLSGCAE